MPNSIFFHVPKTGGTWVTTVLENTVPGAEKLHIDYENKLNLRRQHVYPSKVPRKVRGSKLLFCFVRNPYEWYRSFWSYRVPAGWDLGHENENINPSVVDVRCGNKDFNEFVLNCVKVFPKGLLTTIYKKYVDHVHFVGRQESLREDLVKILSSAGETFDYKYIMGKGKLNESSANYKVNSVYLDETKERLYENEKWVFERFVYN